MSDWPLQRFASLRRRGGIVARVDARAGTPRTRWSWVELQALGPDLATGLRAALATVIPLALSLQLKVPALAWMAFGGWLATLADPGGSRERRARILCLFVVAGTLLVWGRTDRRSAPGTRGPGARHRRRRRLPAPVDWVGTRRHWDRGRHRGSDLHHRPIHHRACRCGLVRRRRERGGRPVLHPLAGLDASPRPARGGPGLRGARHVRRRGPSHARGRQARPGALDGFRPPASASRSQRHRAGTRGLARCARPARRRVTHGEQPPGPPRPRGEPVPPPDSAGHGAGGALRASDERRREPGHRHPT